MIEKYRNIQTLNGRLGCYAVDDYVTEFHPFTKDTIKDLISDYLSCFNIVEDIDITSARIEDEIPYFRVHIKMETYEFRPKPTKLKVNWSQLPEKEINDFLSKSTQDLLIAAAKEEVLKATGIPPKYLS